MDQPLTKRQLGKDIDTHLRYQWNILDLHVFFFFFFAMFFQVFPTKTLHFGDSLATQQVSGSETAFIEATWSAI